MIETSHYLILSGILFAIGIAGILTRRNVLLILLSIELMLNAGNLSFIAFARDLNDLHGQVFAFFIMAVAACEVTVGLAITILLYRLKGNLDIQSIQEMKG